jgi:hypothetical protein
MPPAPAPGCLVLRAHRPVKAVRSTLLLRGLDRGRWLTTRRVITIRAGYVGSG